MNARTVGIRCLDVPSLCQMSLVSRTWCSKVHPVWRTACLRMGIAVPSTTGSMHDIRMPNPHTCIAPDAREHCLARYYRARWRLRAWADDPAKSVLTTKSPFPVADPNAICYVVPTVGNSGLNRNGGYLAASVSPGVVGFYPETDSGGCTYFLRTGPPISMLTTLAVAHNVT